MASPTPSVVTPPPPQMRPLKTLQLTDPPAFSLQSNREPLWPSNYANTTDYQRITLLNDLRKHMNASELVWNGRSFQNDTMSIVQADERTVAIRKGPLLSVLTTVRPVAPSPPLHPLLRLSPFYGSPPPLACARKSSPES